MQTPEGAKQAAQTNKELYGEDFYRIQGAKGGRVKNPNKGFGSDRKRASEAGRVGGLKSVRKSKSQSQ
jgi:general stress protein YciG